MLSVTIIFCLFAGSFAVFIEPGPCPHINTVETDLSRLAGRWYQYASTENGYVSGLKCVMHDLFPLENNVAIAISTAELEKTGDHSIIESNITISEDYVIRTFTSGRIIGFRSFTFQNFEVVYGSHFVALGCENFGSNHVKAVTIFTYDKFPSENLIEEARQLLADYGISVSDFKKFDHENCN
ncbi:hypothetical protein KQX54_006123 [Cotesia glomerata]|uniref:Uncharacterized protein n=1 Tax=Cotesia glomerata TaxID=32391 RepID=A0AAV7IBG7_COTGL|nr:hypothetical protein KQX54_006123 [Cotesia glomerata]